MFFYRVTKYIPKNRDSNGIYLLDEWTFYAQIGTVVSGKIFANDCFFKKIKDVISINKTDVDLLIRLILREKLWCMFTSKSMSVRFGWDYYMYIGSVNKCVKGIKKVEQQGLFVEECDSEYLDA